VKVEIIVREGPNKHLTVGFARELAMCLAVVRARLDAFPDDRPRSRTTSGFVLGHNGTLITVDIKTPTGE
jgi:hypothetical protein